MTKFEEKIEEAKQRVYAMDRVDGVRDRSLKTIAKVLDVGLRRPDTGSAYDALVMLGDRIIEEDSK